MSEEQPPAPQPMPEQQPAAAAVPPPAQTYPPQQPQSQKSSGMKVCLIIAAVVFGIFLLGAGTCVFVVGKGVKDVSKNINEQEQQSACKGNTGNLASANYPDKQGTDCLAGADGTVEVGQQKVTATGWQRVTDPTFNNKLICGNVAITNTASKTQSYNEFDFKIQDPSGAVEGPALSGGDGKLSSGQLVTGGNTSGKVCLKDSGKSGQYVVIFKPGVERARGIWLVNL